MNMTSLFVYICFQTVCYYDYIQRSGLYGSGLAQAGSR